MTFGGFIALVQRAFDSTQIGGIFRAIVRRTHHVISEGHPVGAGTGAAAAEAAAGRDHDRGHALRGARCARVSGSCGAGAAGPQNSAFVEVVPIAGQYVTPGTVILRLHGAGQEPSADLARRVLVLARQRTIDQDPAFGLRMLVDIAIRALSPAVNDPTTAVQALDRIESLLVDLHRRRPGPVIVADAGGEPRGLSRCRPGRSTSTLG